MMSSWRRRLRALSTRLRPPLPILVTQPLSSRDSPFAFIPHTTLLFDLINHFSIPSDRQPLSIPSTTSSNINKTCLTTGHPSPRSEARSADQAHKSVRPPSRARARSTPPHAVAPSLALRRNTLLQMYVPLSSGLLHLLLISILDQRQPRRPTPHQSRPRRWACSHKEGA